MNINNTHFVTGLIGDDSILHNGRSHVAFIGRSNVGKSSLINSMVNNKSLAKSSSTPGKTLQINVFDTKEFYLLDFPGYGYAQIDQKKREKIRKMIIWYLTECTDPKRFFVLVVDAKAGVTDYEKDVLKMLADLELRYIVVANKIDKLNQSEVARLTSELNLIIPEKQYMLYSSVKHKGRDELLDIISRNI